MWALIWLHSLMMGDGFPGWVRQLEGDTGKQTCLQRCGPPTNNSVTVYADVGLWVSPFVSLVNITKPYKFSVLRQPSDTYVVRNDCITPDTFIIASVELSSELKTAMMIVQYKQLPKQQVAIQPLPQGHVGQSEDQPNKGDEPTKTLPSIHKHWKWCFWILSRGSSECSGPENVKVSHEKKKFGSFQNTVRSVFLISNLRRPSFLFIFFPSRL